MQRLQQLFGSGMGGMGGGGAGADVPVPDTAETVYVSSLALLRMLRHARAGVPQEVMGLMLGEFIDEYTVNVVDVFAMPQSGTGVSVEAVDPVYQMEMLQMLSQVGRSEACIGWYHSHPGFGCWLSGVDCNTQASFEKLTSRAVAVVVDPIQSVKGKVVIDAFRLISPQLLMLGQEPRQTTSVVGHLARPSVQALVHGLNRNYYSMPIAYRKNELEQQMLLNLHKSNWTDGLSLDNYEQLETRNVDSLQRVQKLTGEYTKWLQEETELSAEKRAIQNVGKREPKRHLADNVELMLNENLLQLVGSLVDAISF